jgi:hypothetical protein
LAASKALLPGHLGPGNTAKTDSFQIITNIRVGRASLVLQPEGKTFQPSDQEIIQHAAKLKDV